MQSGQVPTLGVLCSNGDETWNTKQQLQLGNAVFRCEGNRQCKGQNLRLAGCRVKWPVFVCSSVHWLCVLVLILESFSQRLP